jgi:hypothetical protein
VLHEIAHALAGRAAGHGVAWRNKATHLGYTGGRTFDVPEARLSARWLGVCADGHQVYRHRRPRSPVWCGTCARAGFRHKISWEDRGLGLLARG